MTELNIVYIIFPQRWKTINKVRSCSYNWYIWVCILLTIWENFLERINGSNKYLQQKDESLNTAVLIYDSLIDFFQTVRDDFDNLENEATKFKNIAYWNDKKRLKVRKLFYDETPENECRFSGKEHFKVNIFFWCAIH